MALIPLAGRSHVLGQLFDVLAPYGGKAGLKVCQFLIRQENILVTAIGAGALTLSILYTLISNIWWTNVPPGYMVDKCPPRRMGAVFDVSTAYALSFSVPPR